MLTTKQEKFCTEYIRRGIASDAYRSAYSCSKMKDETIWSNASVLLKSSKVAARIGLLRKEIEKKSIAEITDLQKFWTDIFKSEVTEMNFRLKSSELLGKSKGAFTENINHSGGVTIIKDDI
jgi:phage terminase small subunit